MPAILANSLVDGFTISTFTGQAIVVSQLAFGFLGLAVVLGKWRQILQAQRATARFLDDFSASGEVLEYYMNRRPATDTGVEGIYRRTCERLLRVISPDVRTLLAGHGAEGGAAVALTAREIDLVRGTCVYVLEQEQMRLGKYMGLVATVVALSPMLGLLGTVWGVLDAFAEMGTAASANLATIAPSISSALVTTVVGLLIAIPGVMCFNYQSALVDKLTAQAEGFADELIARIACEFQGRES